MKIGIKCDGCGLDDWVEFTRFYDFDAHHEKITYTCKNCFHMHTVDENLTIKENVV